MYIPAEYRQTDRDTAIAFMKQHPFAVIVSVEDGKPVATHLPFYIHADSERITLSAHFAKANPQWKGLKEAMVIFGGPHAYISPSLYDKEVSVPTWNYIAIHASGTVQIVEEEAGGMAILENLIAQSEIGYKAQWEGLPEDYKRNLYKGIVPFTITVLKLEAKEKLSQDKSIPEQQRIAAALSESHDSAENNIGRCMRNNQSVE